jgi:ABC-2 type transport system permease protein
VPAVAFDFPAALPWVGLAAALIVSMGAANLYGDDGTGLWPTRMVPGVERADVRGRQAAWLLVVAPAALALTAALTVLGGQGWAWPWLLAVLPAVLGGTAGLMMVVSVARPVRQKDPHRRSGPFDTGDDPNAAGALIGRQYLMLALTAACAVPGAVLMLLGVLRDQPALQAAGALAGTAIGVLLCWWGGRVAARRLADHGAELLDLFQLGPQEPAPRAARGRRPAAVAGQVGRPRRPADRRDPADRPPGAGAHRPQPVRRRPPGAGLVRRPLPPPAAAGPGGGRLGRRRCARPLVGRPHRAPRETFLSVSR